LSIPPVPFPHDEERVRPQPGRGPRAGSLGGSARGELTREAGISHAYYEILVQLSETEGRALRMSELAERCLSSRSRLSHAVSRLEERGWVRRQVCAEDGRGQLAVLTDEGFAALAAAAPVHVESVRRHLFDQLSPGQVAAVRDIGETLLRHLSDD
jgi:DNA-binding MarR family transcriptional regulator